MEVLTLFLAEEAAASVDESIKAPSKVELPARRVLDLPQSIEVLDTRVDLADGQLLVMKDYAEKCRKEVLENGQKLEWQLDQIKSGQKGLDTLSSIVTVAVGVFAAFEFLRVSFSVIRRIRNRIQESMGRNAGVEEMDGESEEQFNEGQGQQLHARQWSL